MANHENDRWVDQRLANLSASHNWQPNAARAFAKFQAETRGKAPVARRWIWTTAVALCAYFTLLVLPASHACAEQPGPCVLRALGVSSRPAPPPPTLEIYVDHHSPECETFMHEVLPELTEFYVRPGKLKLEFKDSPSRPSQGAPIAAIVRDGNREFIKETPLSFSVLEKKLDSGSK